MIKEHNEKLKKRKFSQFEKENITPHAHSNPFSHPNDGKNNALNFSIAKKKKFNNNKNNIRPISDFNKNGLKSINNIINNMNIQQQNFININKQVLKTTKKSENFSKESDKISNKNNFRINRFDTSNINKNYPNNNTNKINNFTTQPTSSNKNFKRGLTISQETIHNKNSKTRLDKSIKKIRNKSCKITTIKTISYCPRIHNSQDIKKVN
jgi:hypothetical protein